MINKCYSIIRIFNFANRSYGDTERMTEEIIEKIVFLVFKNWRRNLTGGKLLYLITLLD